MSPHLFYYFNGRVIPTRNMHKKSQKIKKNGKTHTLQTLKRISKSGDKNIHRCLVFLSNFSFRRFFGKHRCLGVVWGQWRRRFPRWAHWQFHSSDGVEKTEYRWPWIFILCFNGRPIIMLPYYRPYYTSCSFSRLSVCPSVPYGLKNKKKRLETKNGIG